jgi:hypothetical protein
MNERSSNKLVPLLALAAALVIPALLPQSAHGMYDPKHGRWLQRDPLGVRPDAPRGRIEPARQSDRGANRYEGMGSNPQKLVDPMGLKEKPCECERIYPKVPAAMQPSTWTWLPGDWTLLVGGVTDYDRNQKTLPAGTTGVSVAWAVQAKGVWCRQYTELFKCCWNGCPKIFWGEPSYACVAVDTERWPGGKMPNELMVTLNSFTLAAPLPYEQTIDLLEYTIYRIATGYDRGTLEGIIKRQTDKNKLAAATNLTTGSIFWQNPPTLPYASKNRGQGWFTGPVSNVWCDPGGTAAPWPGTKPSNQVPSPKPWPRFRQW